MHIIPTEEEGGAGLRGTGALRDGHFEHPGEQVVIVDDILRTGKKLVELKQLLESRGATVVGLAVIIYQPTPDTHDFGNLPLYYLAKLDARYYADATRCELCRRGVPLEKVWL